VTKDCIFQGKLIYQSQCEQEGIGKYNAVNARLGVLSPSFGGRGGLKGLGMDPLSSSVVTYYRLPITIGLSLTVFAVLRLVTDRRLMYTLRRLYCRIILCVCVDKGVVEGGGNGLRVLSEEDRGDLTFLYIPE